MSTIDDVARLAGVSTATVSRALRSLPNVSQATRTRVMEAVDELGYRPDPSAQRLAAGRSDTLGVVCVDPSDPTTSRVLAGIADRTGDLVLLSGEITEPSAMVDRVLDISRRVDGVIVVGHALGDDELDALGAKRPTMVTAGALVDGVDGVMVDEGAAVESAVAHLRRLGHDAIVHWDTDPDTHVAGSAAHERRRSVLRAGGITVAAVDDSIAGAGEGLDQLLASSATAVIAAGASLGIGALLAARRTGIEVPGELSIVGFDPHDTAEVAGLTSVAGDQRHVGRLAADRLRSRIDDPAAPRHERLPVTLRVRASTAPPGGGPPTDAVWL